MRKQFFVEIGRWLTAASASLALLSYETRADDVGWAAGQWTGYIQDWRRAQPTRDIGARLLAITVAATDAAPSVKWGAPAADLVSVDATLDGGSLKFGYDGATVNLRRDGSDKLTGTFIGRLGKRFPLMLARAKPVSAYDGSWSGTSVSDQPRCFPGTYRLSVENGHVSGIVRFVPAPQETAVPPPPDAPAGGKGRRVSDVEGEVWAGGVVFLRLKKRADHGRNSWFHGQIEGASLTGDDAGYNEADCSYRVTLEKTPS
jgi:hypothetical protein